MKGTEYSLEVDGVELYEDAEIRDELIVGGKEVVIREKCEGLKEICEIIVEKTGSSLSTSQSSMSAGTSQEGK